MYKQRKQYKFVKLFNESATIICQAYKRYKIAKAFKEKINEKLRDELELWK